MSNRFPKDCFGKKCDHFHTRNLNVDDLVCSCDLLKVTVDACDEDFSYFICPRNDDEFLEDLRIEQQEQM